MENKNNSNLNFKKYVLLRIMIHESHSLQWQLLDEKILSLMKQIEDVTPEVIEDIKKAYDILSQVVIPSVFPTDFPIPKDFDELSNQEIPLLEKIPEVIRKTFNILFKAYLKKSINNALSPEDSLFNLLTKFNNENAELRYPDNNSNPYLQYSYRPKNSNYNWKKKATDEFYPYYYGFLNLLSSIRNFEIHKEDAFTSTRFDLAKRNLLDPISGIENPGNYLVLSNLVILSSYEFIEILQIWLDTQARIGRI